ncbi:MAG: DUF1302 family protein [Proteobacteria bacterium]|nr:DUF1302 family protein [Pseudomonadota bacterium]
MKKRHYYLSILLSTLLLAVMAGGAQAIDLADGKFVIHGKISEQLNMRADKTSPGQLYDYSIFNFRTSFKLETMYHIQQCPDHEWNAYGVWKQFYDYADKVDTGFDNYVRHMSGDKGISQLRAYHSFVDVCRELYLEYTTSLFQVRAGKQIISWGETSFERTADIINPVDGRGLLNPGYPDFAEIKRGLWMFRLYYTPRGLPADMTFEGLIIPDFQPNYNWPAGYHLMHPDQFNLLKAPNELFLNAYRDAPSDSWKNPQIGFRIRGFTWGFDWTVFYVNMQNPNGTYKTGKALPAQLIAALGPGSLGGRVPYTNDVTNFQRYNNVGFTFNRPIAPVIPLIPCTPVRMSGCVFRNEFIAELSKKCADLVGINNVTRSYNRYADTLAWDGKIFIPGLSPWNRGKLLSTSTQLAQEWVPSKKDTYQIFPYNVYSPGRKYWATMTEAIDYGFWNDRILVGLYAAYQLTPGKSYYTLMAAFKPTFRWTYMIRYLDYREGSTVRGYPTGPLDTVTFDITYEF